jgi:hypothetical protein
MGRLGGGVELGGYSLSVSSNGTHPTHVTPVKTQPAKGTVIRVNAYRRWPDDLNNS